MYLLKHIFKILLLKITFLIMTTFFYLFKIKSLHKKLFYYFSHYILTKILKAFFKINIMHSNTLVKIEKFVHAYFIRWNFNFCIIKCFNLLPLKTFLKLWINIIKCYEVKWSFYWNFLFFERNTFVGKTFHLPQKIALWWYVVFIS